MDDKKDQRLNLRVTVTDKQMADAIAKKLNISTSDVWRLALKQCYDNYVKPSK